jgi:hypothetical protein
LRWRLRLQNRERQTSCECPTSDAGKAVESGERSAVDRQRFLSWAQRLKRVFAIDIEMCRRCGGKLKVIASVEDPPVIERILEHLDGDGEPADPAHPSREPPPADLLF